MVLKLVENKKGNLCKNALASIFQREKQMLQQIFKCFHLLRNDDLKKNPKPNNGCTNHRLLQVRKTMRLWYSAEEKFYGHFFPSPLSPSMSLSLPEWQLNVPSAREMPVRIMKFVFLRDVGAPIAWRSAEWQIHSDTLRS